MLKILLLEVRDEPITAPERPIKMTKRKVRGRREEGKESLY
jgi:hypothetical protein